VTTTVGIADADILEVRIMSLLRKTKPDTTRKRVLLIAASLFLLVPCLAVASFAMKFDLASQEPTPQEKARRDKEKSEARGSLTEDQIKERQMREIDQVKLRLTNDPQFHEELQRKLQI
ncbi:MAG: hypothetical protein DMF69_09700, partial [Acidobacteria bacterium]